LLAALICSTSRLVAIVERSIRITRTASSCRSSVADRTTPGHVPLHRPDAELRQLNQNGPRSRWIPARTGIHGVRGTTTSRTRIRTPSWGAGSITLHQQQQDRISGKIYLTNVIIHGPRRSDHHFGGADPAGAERMPDHQTRSAASCRAAWPTWGSASTVVGFQKHGAARQIPNPFLGPERGPWASSMRGGLRHHQQRHDARRHAWA